MLKIKAGDEVIAIAGRDKGKTGKVTKVLDNDRLLVQGVNMVKRHTKPDPARNVAGGIVPKEAPLHKSNVAIYNPSTQKADKVGCRFLDDGKKVRFYKSTGEEIS